MKKIIISTIMTLSFIDTTQAADKNGDLKSSATIEATCLISANSIGFGSIALPLLAQSANSEMTVKCSNASAYTINLAYGGIYGQTSVGNGVQARFSANNAHVNEYQLFNSSGVNVGLMLCGYNGKIGQVWFSDTRGANLYGYQTSGWQSDTQNNACISNNTQSGTYPKGWMGAYNASGIQSIGSSSYDYGIMSGMSKGDKLAYSIQLPSDSTTVWNGNKNSFKSTGNGDNQTIPLIAKIVPDKSGSKYPAPDMYSDTIIAVISY